MIVRYLKELTITLFLLLSLHTHLQAQYIRFNYTQHFTLSELKSERVNSYFEQQRKDAILDKDTSRLIKNTIALSQIKRTNLKFGEAFDLSSEAIYLSESFNDSLLLATAHENYGVLHYIFRQNETAGYHLRKSLNILNQLQRANKAEPQDLFYTNYFMAIYHHREKNLDSISYYLGNCYILLATTEIPQIDRVFLDTEKAVLLIGENRFKQAEQLLLNSVKMFASLNEQDASAAMYKRFEMDINHSLAVLYESQNMNSKAETYYKKAIEKRKLNGEQIFAISYIKQKYALFLNKNGQAKKAFSYLNSSRQITDAFLNPRRANNREYLSVRNKYREALTLKEKELQEKNLEIAAKKQAILRLRVLTFTILFTLIVIAIIYWGRKQIRNQKQESTRKQQLLQESTQELEHKNKELTSTMLQLIEKEEIINKVSQQLKDAEDNKTILSMLNALRKQSSKLWDTFNNQFIDVNKGFYERLQTQYPNLSTGDLKICALIKLNFSGQEMASLLGISLGGIHLARHRLRKKMNINRDVNLTAFINSI